PQLATATTFAAQPATNENARPWTGRSRCLAEGPWARPRAQERAELVGACRRPPRPTRLPAGTSRVLGFTGRLGAPAACWDDRLSGRIPRSRLQGTFPARPRAVTDCEYAGLLAQPVFSESWRAGNPAPPGARNAHFVVSGSQVIGYVIAPQSLVPESQFPAARAPTRTGLRIAARVRPAPGTPRGWRARTPGGPRRPENPAGAPSRSARGSGR